MTSIIHQPMWEIVINDFLTCFWINFFWKTIIHIWTSIGHSHVHMINETVENLTNVSNREQASQQEIEFNLHKCDNRHKQLHNWPPKKINYYDYAGHNMKEKNHTRTANEKKRQTNSMPSDGKMDARSHGEMRTSTKKITWAIYSD